MFSNLREFQLPPLVTTGVIVVFSITLGAALCMASQTLVKLDEVEIAEEKEKKRISIQLSHEEERKRLKYVPDWRRARVDLQKNECLEKLPLISYSPKKIAVYYNGSLIASSNKVICFMQDKYSPRYFFPKNDVKIEYIMETNVEGFNSMAGRTHWCNIKVGTQIVESAAQRLFSVSEDFPELLDHYYFSWAKLEKVTEEDEVVHSRPKNPWVRIDSLHSSRHVVININGVKIAETRRPVLMFETGVPTRYYIPKGDIKMDQLEQVSSDSFCAYRGKPTLWKILGVDDFQATSCLS